MSIENTTPSHQQRQHWLSEQALAWSGLPVVTIRPTMFLESEGAAMRLHTKEERCSSLRLWHRESSDKQRK